MDVSLSNILAFFGTSRAPREDQWYERTSLAQYQSDWVVKKKLPTEMLSNAANFLAEAGNVMEIVTDVDNAVGSKTFYCNSSRHLIQDGKAAVSKLRIKQMSAPYKSSDKRDFKTVCDECTSLHKITAYVPPGVKSSVADGYVYICDCLQFKVIHIFLKISI